jgi:hypothetical protein
LWVRFTHERSKVAIGLGLTMSMFKRSIRPLALAISSIVIGVTAFALSFLSAGSGFATRNDPGPWLLPRVLSLGLVAGGIMLLVLDRRKVHSLEPASETEPVAGRPVLELLGGVVAYVAALPWAGFLIATALFSGLLLWRMKIIWWRAAVAALALTLVAHGLFALLFKVPLPTGAWN